MNIVMVVSKMLENVIIIGYVCWLIFVIKIYCFWLVYLGLLN